MADWISWFVIAGIVVILEIFTGTFYLLMIGLGLAAGGAVALTGASGPLQTIIAAAVGVVATVALHRSKFGKFNQGDAALDPNVNLDIGQTLMINNWHTDKSGNSTARTMYRGAMWDIELAQGATAQPGRFAIREIRGSRLVVANL